VTERIRCPRCNRYGNKDLGGYCQSCKTKRRKANYVGRGMMKAGYGFRFDPEPLAPDKFGIIREDFKIQDKGQ